MHAVSKKKAALLLLLAALPCAAATFTFHIEGDEPKPGAWKQALSSLGLLPAGVASADVLVLPEGIASGTELTAEALRARIEQGTIVVLEGPSGIAESFGFRPMDEGAAGSAAVPAQVAIRSVEDARNPDLRIIWEQEITIARFQVPDRATVFARERWEGAPLLAGYREGKGAVLWLATSIGMRSYDRFPYLPQALADLGLEAGFRSPNLWAFFDSSYRARVDLDYFAPRWRAAGISALHVAAWHYWERNETADDYLRRLIIACHRNGIQVYAWFELPHVSEQFWDDHPEWREKTALGQDAKLDWRKLMNLTSRKAFAEVSRGLRDLVERFDWDGVNLAELYFESLEGADDPARFTPLNDDVRREFLAFNGFDPIDIFNRESELSISKTAAPLAQFLDFRAELARRQQAEWITEVESIRRGKPWLDLVLTHVDDRFDTTMRDKIGADTSKTLPLLSEHDFTFLIEDPATIWDLGPQRYPQIAARYQGITPRPEKLAIDINIVERYQDVYPTKQQTGMELFELVHTAAGAFPRVTLYFESSISKIDQPLLAASAATVEGVRRVPGAMQVDAAHPVGVAWSGPALVDGRVWPVQTVAAHVEDTEDGSAPSDDPGETWVWLPAGSHTIEPGLPSPLYLTDLNAQLDSASATSTGIEFAYQSGARALARLSRMPSRVEVDGVKIEPEIIGNTLILPRGQHVVTVTR